MQKSRITTDAGEVYGEGSAPPPALPEDNPLYGLDNVTHPAPSGVGLGRYLAFPKLRPYEESGEVAKSLAGTQYDSDLRG